MPIQTRLCWARQNSCLDNVIYVHVPFCRSFCTYCDFYSEVAAKCRKADEAMKQEALFGDFAEALAEEATLRSGEITNQVNTLYIGGGTPSVLPLAAFTRLLDALRSAGHNCQFDEFTVEVNPEDIVEKGPAYVEGLMKLGVNRVSMGVQSFDDEILRFMNRRHNVEAAVTAYAALEEAGVKNISIDLIFGFPQLPSQRWRETVDKALNISSLGNLPKHISSYQLSVEPGSMLAKLVERGAWKEAEEGQCQEQYSILCEMLGSAGYNHYEISNFAQPGYEAKHNSAYWRHIPYVGLGPGAHSMKSSDSSIERRWNREDLAAYIKEPLSVQDGETLTEEQVALEKIMLGLRTSLGVRESYLRAHCDKAELEKTLRSGNLEPIFVEGHCSLRIPENRFFISDAIICSLV